MDKQQEFVLRTLEERDIRFVRLWFTDVLGFLKSVAVAPAELEGAFAEGIGFDGSAIEGFARVYESDMLAKPDPATFQVLPWRGETPGDAPGCSATSCMPDGSPSLRRPALRAEARAGQGRRPRLHLLHPPRDRVLPVRGPARRPAAPPVPVDPGGYFDHTPHGVGHDFRRDAITMLESMGISVEFSHHEGAPGQQEIDLRYADALTTADNIMTFRLVMKEVALEQGVYASFMPKPFTDHPGSGMHTHLSLFEGDRNAFFEAGARVPAVQGRPRRSSPACCGTRAEITAVTNQWVNSYKRLAGGGEAPAYVCWGHNNRSALVRVPMYKPHKGQLDAGRVPLARLGVQPLPRVRRHARRPASRASRRATSCREGAEDDVWSLTDAERRALGIEPLPPNLAEAIRLMERSELVAETLGEHVFDFFLRNKRAEWDDYRRQVTPYELDRYLPVLLVRDCDGRRGVPRRRSTSRTTGRRLVRRVARRGGPRRSTSRTPYAGDARPTAADDVRRPASCSAVRWRRPTTTPLPLAAGDPRAAGRRRSRRRCRCSASAWAPSCWRVGCGGAVRRGTAGPELGRARPRAAPRPPADDPVLGALAGRPPVRAVALGGDRRALPAGRRCWPAPDVREPGVPGR